MKMSFHNPEDNPPVAPFTQAVEVQEATRTLYISGQVGQSADGTGPENFADQAKLAWQHVVDNLAAAGMGVENLVKVTTYLVHRSFSPENAQVRSSFLGEHRPAMTLVIAELYRPEWLIEVEAIAVA